jgi:hypothetical protein
MVSTRCTRRLIMRIARTCIGLGLVAAALPLGGCGSTPPAPSEPDRRAPALHVSRVKDYDTTHELRQDSTAIIIGTAVSAEPGDLSGVTTTVTSVRVERTLWGSTPSQVLRIQQLGNTSMALPDTSKILTTGERYLLFVTPFHMTPKDDTGLYLITGERGVWESRSSGRYVLVGGDPDETSLPRSFSGEDVSRGRI